MFSWQASIRHCRLLVNEVKGIYAGLVMVETKCVEVTRVDSPYLHGLPTFILQINQQQSSTTNK